MKKLLLIAAFLALFIVNDPAMGQFGAKAEVSWETDLKTAVDLAVKQRKPLMLHFWTESCGPCRILDRDVFVQPELSEAIASGVIAVKINAQKQREIADRYGIKTVPQDVFLTPNGYVLLKRQSPRKTKDYVRLVNAIAQLHQTQDALIQRNAPENRVTMKQHAEQKAQSHEKEFIAHVEKSHQIQSGRTPSPTGSQFQTPNFQPPSFSREPTGKEMTIENPYLVQSNNAQDTGPQEEVFPLETSPEKPAVFESQSNTQPSFKIARKANSEPGKSTARFYEKESGFLPNNPAESPATVAPSSFVKSDSSAATHTQSPSQYSAPQAQAPVNSFAQTQAPQQPKNVVRNPFINMQSTHTQSPPRSQQYQPQQYQPQTQQAFQPQPQQHPPQQRYQTQPQAYQPQQYPNNRAPQMAQQMPAGNRAAQFGGQPGPIPQNQFVAPQQQQHAGTHNPYLAQQPNGGNPAAAPNAYQPQQNQFQPSGTMQPTQQGNPMTSPSVANHAPAGSNDFRPTVQGPNNILPTPTAFIPQPNTAPQSNAALQLNPNPQPSIAAETAKTAPKAFQPPAEVTSAKPTEPTPGLEGFCPVSLHEDKKWTKGDEAFGCYHRDKLYLFASKDYRDLFLAKPDRYGPALSGYDPVLFADTGKLVEGKREIGVFFPKTESRIYVFATPESKKKFQADPEKYSNAVKVATAAVDGQKTMR